MPKPRLRTVSKVDPPYPLGRFPRGFIFKLGAQIVYHLATSGQAELEGAEWERLFAEAVGAKWKPSNVGLDDVVLGVCAWGAKTVKATKASKQTKVRLISGRNSPGYSFPDTDLADPQEIGNSVLSIWNARVESVRSKYSDLRTVVLIKSKELSEFCVFETETIRYPTDNYTWQRNAHRNLEAIEISTGIHRFTWQPHGSQFTIIEQVPPNRACFRVRKPPRLDPEATLKAIGFDESWIEIVT